MGFYEVANHWLIYVLVLMGILFVACFALLSLRKSWRRAGQIGYSKQKLMSVVKASVSYTIVPSIAIVVGFFTIAAVLGVPWPWWRLSVIGALTYELMAADMALGAVGLEIANIAEATGADFILIMYVMTLGIMGGLCVVPFLGKRIQSGAMKLKDRDQRWGALGTSVFMMTIILVFLIPMILKGGVTLLTLLTSAVIALLLSALVKRFKLTWLSSFVLAITLLGAMASSVLWTRLLG